MAEAIIRRPEPGEFPETWGNELGRYVQFLRQFLTQANPETAGAQVGQSTRDALGLATMGIGARPNPSGFRSVSNTIAAMRAKGANPAELGPAGPTAMEARDQLAENMLPTIQSAMRRVRPMERSTPGGTAPRVSAQDLAQDFVAKDLQGVIDRYDPSQGKSLDAAIRSRAAAGSRSAREMEAAVPKPGEGDIHRMSAKIAKEQDNFRKQYGRDPSYMWLARKFNMTPAAMKDALEAKDQNQIHGSVRFDDLAGQTRRPYAEMIGSEGQTGGATNPGRVPQAMLDIEGKASENPNMAAATKFMDQLDPQRKAILEKMMDNKPTRQIAAELQAEGHDISQPTVVRRQNELMKQMKQLREGTGFLGGLGGQQEKTPPTLIKNPKNISGGSDDYPPVPSNAQQAIEKLGHKFEGTTEGLTPEGPKFHWFSHPLANGDMTTGLVEDTPEKWNEYYQRFQKPIGGGTGNFGPEYKSNPGLRESLDRLNNMTLDPGGYARPPMVNKSGDTSTTVPYVRGGTIPNRGLQTSSGQPGDPRRVPLDVLGSSYFGDNSYQPGGNIGPQPRVLDIGQPEALRTFVKKLLEARPAY